MNPMPPPVCSGAVRHGTRGMNVIRPAVERHHRPSTGRISAVLWAMGLTGCTTTAVDPKTVIHGEISDQRNASHARQLDRGAAPVRSAFANPSVFR